MGLDEVWMREKQKHRHQILYFIHLDCEEHNGDGLSVATLCNILPLNGLEVAQALKYLYQEGLITSKSGIFPGQGQPEGDKYRITHEGIKKMEQLILQPDQGNEPLSASVNHQHFYGQTFVQQGNHNIMSVTQPEPKPEELKP
ncbi:hypothetical protein GCM10008938_32590 [Deinococcus roseus]|uniref:Uncharacterized protein n=2 Tax=Deinococcus roseus TaxID=392414 RepID=A0ABQ2D4B8_9DEIO|nr:hypothetical protein GCM10008938_32590 [Deinococcus roseus]